MLYWDELFGSTPKIENNVEASYEPVAYEPTQYEEVKSNRGVVDRVFGTMMNTSITNALYNATDSNPNTGFIKGLGEGVSAMNPFADDVSYGNHTTSDVLGNLGWKPESMLGKVGKGAVSLAGDIVLDPMSYINPFSAASKVVKGTGKTSLNMLTDDSAKTVIDTFYKVRGIDKATLDPEKYAKEVLDLKDSFNKKILKTSEGGQDFSVGANHLPFASKIKVGDKTIDSFSKTLVKADTLRAVGDKTIAPYYNRFAETVRNTKAMQKFNKYADLENLAKTNPMQASAILKLDELLKNFDDTSIDKDMAVVSDSKFINELNEEEKSFVVDFIESGDWKNYKIIRDKIDTIKSRGERSAKNASKRADKKEDYMTNLNAIEDRLTKMTAESKVAPDKKKYTTSDYLNDWTLKERFMKFKPEKVDYNEDNVDNMFDTFLKNGEYDDWLHEYAQDPMNKIDVKGLTKDYIDPELLNKQNAVKKKIQAYNTDFEAGKGNPELRASLLNEFNEINSTIASSRDVYNKKPVVEAMKKDEKAIAQLKETFTGKNEFTKEGRDQSMTPQSKMTLINQLNTEFFRGNTVIHDDIPDKVLNEFLSGIEKKDYVYARDQLLDSVLTYNYNSSTYKELYARANDKFDYAKYGITGKFNNSPHVTKIAKNATEAEKRASFKKVSDVPELLQKYNGGDKQYEGLLTRVAGELGLKNIDELNKVNTNLFYDYADEFARAKGSLSRNTTSGANSMDYANAVLKKDVEGAIREEGDFKFKQAMSDEAFDYRDVSEHKVLSDYEYQTKYDGMRDRIVRSTDTQPRQLDSDTLKIFDDIVESEGDIFGVMGKLGSSKMPTNDKEKYSILATFAKNQNSEIGNKVRLGEGSRNINKAQKEYPKLQNQLVSINDRIKVIDNLIPYHEIHPISPKINDLLVEREELYKKIDGYDDVELGGRVYGVNEKLKHIEQILKKTPFSTQIEEIKNNIARNEDEIKIFERNLVTATSREEFKIAQKEQNIRLYENEVLKGRLTKLNKSYSDVKAVRERLTARGSQGNKELNATTEEIYNFQKLSPEEQLNVANHYKSSKRLSFINKMNNMSVNNIETEMIKITVDPNISNIRKHEYINEYNKYLKRRKYAVSNGQFDSKYFNAKDHAEMKKTLTEQRDELTKKIGEFDTNSANRTADYFLSNQYVNDEISRETGKTIEEVQRLMKLGEKEKTVEASEYLSDKLYAMGEKEVALGKLSKEQLEALKDRYIPHIATDEGLRYFTEQIIREHNGKYNPKTAGVGKFKQFDKHRTFETIEKANEYYKSIGVEKAFETDLSDLFVSRAIGHNELVFGEEMTSAIKGVFGKKYHIGEDLKGYTPCITYSDLRNRLKSKIAYDTGVEFKDAVIPDELLRSYGIEPVLFSQNMSYIKLTHEQVRKIASETLADSKKGLEIFNLKDELFSRLNKQSRTQSQMLTSDTLNLYDKFLYTYKLWNSVINPGFHAQNAVSNAFQSFMSSGKAILEPHRYSQANEIFTGVTPHKVVNINGEEITHGQIKMLAEKYGILDNTFFKEDINVVPEKGWLGKRGVPSALDPTDFDKFIPYKAGKAVGSKIEGNQRLVLFIKNLEDGKSVKESVEDVDKFLFDYSDLTDFEKDTMKRVFPFYTYMRKNIPLQLEQMLQKPQFYMGINKTFDNIEEMSGEDQIEDFQKDEWKNDFIQMPFTVGGEKFGINPQLPYQQLDRLKPNRLFGQTTPVIKTPAELLSGEYAYTGIPIDSMGDYLASQTTPTKVFNQSQDKEGTAKQLYLMGQLQGFPMTTL